MKLFEGTAKTGHVQHIIDDLNTNIEEMNTMLQTFREYVMNLDFDGAIVSLEYLNKVKIKMDGFIFLINDRLSTLKDPIFIKVIQYQGDATLEDYIAGLKKELIVDYEVIYKKNYNMIMDNDAIEVKVLNEEEENE